MTPSEIFTRPHAAALAAPGGGPDTGISALLVPLVVVLLVGGLAIFAYTRRKRRAEARTTPAGSRQQQGWSDDEEPRQPPPAPLPLLDSESKQLLAGTDEAIRTSTEELALATARFGEESAQPFTEALTYAGNRLSTALRIRRRLDDAPPEDEAIRRRMLDEIVALCTEADQRLAAESLHREHHGDRQGERGVDRP